MKRVFRGIVSVFAFTVLNVLSLGVHASAALPMNMEHSMGAAHQMGSSSCFTVCTTATLHKEDVIKEINKDEDDKSLPPFYVQFQTSSLVALKEKHNQETRFILDYEPPPGGVPAYIGMGVFRA